MSASSALRLLRSCDYRVTPWKNGQGVTHDILLLPEGSGHDDFDIRISRAPIAGEAPFSSFPGIDRRITLLSGDDFDLVFEDGARLPLRWLQPQGFDSARAPSPRLPGGPVTVLNVMTRRGRWRSQVEPLAGGAVLHLQPADGALVVLHAVSGDWTITAGKAEVRAGAGETLLAHGGSELALAGGQPAEALLAVLTPAAEGA